METLAMSRKKVPRGGFAEGSLGWAEASHPSRRFAAGARVEVDPIARCHGIFSSSKV
jgi:hypothetical protein